ncbi:MAG TPA: adenylate cyclase regulatory domain-containing protein [Actinomycetota bacterium]|nr:adenylate cyclase regulatory domain-containing protein [Actinomycetota bacterium]
MQPIDPARFRDVPTLTGVEVSRRAGVDHAFAKRVWLTLGLPDVPDEDVEFDESDVEVLRGLKLILDQGYPEEDIVEIARAYGHAMSRVAHAEVRVFNKVFITPLREQTRDDDDLARRLEAVVPALLELLGKLVDHVHRRHLAIALQEVTASASAGSTDTLATGFVDLVDFSRVTQELEGEDLGHLVNRFESMAIETCVAGGAHVVKMIGDAVMFVAPDPVTALRVALAVVAGVEDDEALPAARAGLDYGAVVPMSGDFFGRPVNVAARLTSFARPGTVVVSEAVVDAAGVPLQSSHIGRVRLHNVGQVRAFKVAGVGEP